MNPAVHLVRWLNRTCPWNQYKHSLTRRVDRFIDTTGGVGEYAGILGEFRMRLDLSSAYERLIYMNSCELVTVNLLRRLLGPGDVYIDAGANMGLFVLLASRQVGPKGRVYAFEPQPKALERLRGHLTRNDIDNVRLIEKGCWREEGDAALHDFADSHMVEASMAAIADKTLAHTTHISTTRIDEVVNEPARVVKLDVEGAELGALEGARRVLFESGPVPHVIIELNPKTCRAFGYDPMEIVGWLCQHHRGYQAHRIKSKRHVPISRSQLKDLLRRDPHKHLNVWFEP